MTLSASPAAPSHGRKRQCLPARRARTIQTEHRYLHILDSKCRRYELSQQIPGKYIPYILLDYSRLLYGKGHRLTHHLALSFLPGIFAKCCILAHSVKISRHGAVYLLRPRHRCCPQYIWGIAKFYALFSFFLIHIMQLPYMDKCNCYYNSLMHCRL